MPNPHRGEVDAMFGGRRFTLCLTLGALAELEHAFGVEDLAALGRRLSQGRLSARDLQRILGAGLRGGGASLEEADIAALRLDGGLPGAIDAVARLLEATFGSGAEGPPPRP